MKTRVRQSSLDALAEMEASGKSKNQRTKILKLLVRSSGNWSRQEISSHTKIPINAVCGRINELLKVNAIHELGRRPCNVTGKLVYVVTTRDVEE